VNNEHVFFFFPYVIVVVRLSIVYKKNSLSYLSFSLSLSFSHAFPFSLFLSRPVMARSNVRDSHSKYVISQARRASLRVRHELAQSLSFSFSFFLSCRLLPLVSRDEPRKLFLFPSRWDFFFNFASWFSFVLLSVEAIYYFNTVPTTSIDYVEKKESWFPLSLSLLLSLSLSLSLSLARPLSRIATYEQFLLFELVKWRNKFCLLFLPQNSVHAETHTDIQNVSREKNHSKVTLFFLSVN